MVLTGSNGETRSEIIRALKLSSMLGETDSSDQLVKLLSEAKAKTSDLLSANNHEKNQMLKLSNRIILNNFAVDRSYLKSLADHFDADVKSCDKTTTESLKMLIQSTNEWISSETSGKIKNLLDDNFELNALALINVIYFKFDWLNKFDESQTTKKAFSCLLGEKKIKKRVEMMQLRGKKLVYGYSTSLDAHHVSLPYDGDKFTFNVILPVDENDLLNANQARSLINKLDLVALSDELRGELSIHEVNLEMPKFRVEKRIELGSLLKKMGIVSAFDSARADLSAMSMVEKLFIDEALQLAYIDVNEQGTEAAAATAIKISKRSLVQYIDINLNRTFVLYITDKRSSLILFVGIYRAQEIDEQLEEAINDEL